MFGSVLMEAPVSLDARHYFLITSSVLCKCYMYQMERKVEYYNANTALSDNN